MLTDLVVLVVAKGDREMRRDAEILRRFESNSVEVASADTDTVTTDHQWAWYEGSPSSHSEHT